MKQLPEFRHEPVAQGGRCLRAEDWFGGFRDDFYAATARIFVGRNGFDRRLAGRWLFGAGFSAPDPPGIGALRSGASMSSSPAIPTNVNRA